MSDAQISRRCPRCGASIRRIGSFCPQCGNRVAVAHAAKGTDTPKPKSKAEAENPAEYRKGAASADSSVDRPVKVAEPQSGTASVSSSPGLNRLPESKKQIVPQPARRGPSPGGSPQGERIRRPSQTVTGGASVDNSIRFLVVAIALFLGFLVLLIVSQSMR